MENINLGEIAPYFDDLWYREEYRDVDFSFISPMEHYFLYGWLEGMDPSPAFSTSYYLNRHKDVFDARVNPLLHYALYGESEGREIAGSERAAPTQNLIVTAEQRKEIEEIEGFIDDKWYRLNNEASGFYGLNSAEHYHLIGWKRGVNPSMRFNTERYLNLHPDVRLAAVNPLLHYIRHGISEGRSLDYERLSGNVKPSSFRYAIKKEVPGNNIYSVGESVISVPTETIKVVTYDVWDTVIRRYSSPEDVKLAAAYYFLNIAFNSLKDFYHSKKSLYLLRLESEKAAVETDDYEFRYSNSLQIWVASALKSGVSQEYCKEIMSSLYNFELEYEKAHTFVDPSVKKLVQGQVLPAYFISDFYHDKAFLCAILEKHNLLKYFDGGYVSSDFLKTKRTGGLFDIFLGDTGFKSVDVFHVGDNEHSDVHIPEKKYAIKTCHFYNKNLDLRSKVFKKEFDDRLYKGEYEASFDKLMVDFYSNAASDSLYDNGRAFAPVVYGLCLRIMEECLKTGATKIYFFSREGYFIKKAFERLMSSSIYAVSLRNIELHVLEVSRLATLLPSIDAPVLDQWMRIWNQYSTQSPKSFCATLHLPEKKFKKIFEWYGLKFSEPVKYPWLSEKFMCALNSYEFNVAFMECRDSARELLVAYLDEIGARDSSFSIMVDVGWRGTIQDNLAYLCNGHIRGIYLGLESFLNPQPINGDKVGWLFDVNAGDHSPKFDFAPIEMLFNGVGGSVTGYEKKGGVNVKRCIIPDEESVVIRIVNEFQCGVISRLDEICKLCERENLGSDQLSILSLEIIKFFIKSPSSTLSEQFCALTHNETFGADKQESFSAINDFLDVLHQSNSKIHDYTEQLVKASRWPAALANTIKLQEFFSSLSDVQKINVSPELFFPLNKLDVKGLVVGFFAPRPLAGSGGHRTIYNLAKKFYSMGYDIYIFLESGDDESIAVVREYLGFADAMIFTEWMQHIPIDIGIATIAHSASFLAGIKATKTKAYLIQDFEAYFNPMGDGYHIAEQSYIYGLLNCTVGNWLGHVLKTQFNSLSVSSGLGVDIDTYYPIDSIKKEKAICFLFQPEKPRRCPDLAIGALRLLKQKMPDLKIYLYGSNADITLDFEVENLGLIHDLSEINKLYNKCMVGLCLSLTNPSRIPFELMAAGAVPVDVFRYNNLFDYVDGTIELAYQSHSSLADAVEHLLVNKSAYEVRRQNCINFAKSRSLDWEMSVFVNAITLNHFNSFVFNNNNKMTYHALPAIPKSLSVSASSIKAFIDYQVDLAKKI